MSMFLRRAVSCLVVATSLVLTPMGPSSAQSQGPEGLIRDPKQLVQSLRSGGYVIVVRHGATFSDQADTDPFNFNDIAKQRNLNEKGKELAKAFGEAIRQVGTPVGEVYTSNFNRAFETAVLAGFKDVKKTTDLTEGGLVVSPDENSRRAAALRNMLARAPEKGKNTFLITHKPNIGVVRCEGRRSVDFQTRGRQVPAGRARADGGLAEARCCRRVTGRTHGRGAGRTTIGSTRARVAAPQLIELHSIPSSQGRFAGYRMGRDHSAGCLPSQARFSPQSGHRGLGRVMAITKKRFSPPRRNRRRPDAISWDEGALSKESENVPQGRRGSRRPARSWRRLGRRTQRPDLP